MRGFTLIELLVVTLIVAIMLGGAVLTLSDRDARQAARWGAQAQAWIEALCDQALFRQRPMGWRLNHDARTLTAWHPSPPTARPDASSPARLERLLAEALAPSAPQARWVELTDYAPLPWHAPLIVAGETPPDIQWTENATLPPWRCWPTGEYVPGALYIQSAAAPDAVWRLQWNAVGRFTLEKRDARHADTERP